MLVCLITAGIDLSVGSNTVLCACFIGVLVERFGITNAFVLAVAGISVSTLAGFINGTLLTRLDLPHPFVSTLGMKNVLLGTALVITGSKTIGFTNKGVDSLLKLGNTTVLELDAKGTVSYTHLDVYKRQVMRICGHALQTEEKRRTKGNDVRLALPKRHDRDITAAGSFALGDDPVDNMPDGRIIKVHIRERGEKSVDQKARGQPGIAVVFDAGLRQADQLLHQFILEICSFRLLSAHAGTDAAFITRCLLALETKHV